MESDQKLTAMDVLLRYKQEDLPEFLEVDLEHVNQVGNFGNSPLHVACVRGDLEEIKALADAGGDINAHGELGNSPLHEAASQGHDEAVALLLCYGANTRQLNDDQETPRDIARQLGYSKIVAMFDDSSRESSH